MTSNTKREDIINKVFFDEKKDLLKDLAEKNDEQMYVQINTNYKIKYLFLQ